MDDIFDENSQTSSGSKEFTKKKKWTWLMRLLGIGSIVQKAGDDDLLVGHFSGKENTQEMLVNLRNLQTLRLDDISVPKADIIALSDETPFEDVIEVFRTSTFTRVPVYCDTLDNPLGLIHLKDFALSHGFGSSSVFNMKSVLRPLIYVPPSMTLGTLLQRMQAERIHMALVIDEYGGVDGLVTIEDLLEQIVGDIIDEHDAEEDQLWLEERPGVYLVYARLELEDFFEQTGVDLRDPETEEEYDTIGGLVSSLTNRIPVRGEVIKDKMNNEYSVVDADPRSIKRLRVFLTQKNEIDK
jgi:magnesium and cobalt transporter